MSGDIGIGDLIRQERHRDAIHIAVAPIEAGEDLTPGDPVVIVEGKAFKGYENPIGIVDPFVRFKWTVVSKGERFYIFLMPGSITSLRHEWEHPAFVPQVLPAVASKEESEKWLREYAQKVNPHYTAEGHYGKKDGGKDTSYEVLMDDIRGGHDITYHGKDMHCFGDLEEAELLKYHAEIVLGRKIDWGTFEYFSCSC